MEIIFTDRFLDRVEEFSDYIALDNIPAAIRWAEQVFDHCHMLQSNPEIGRMVPEFRRPEIRELIHGKNYRLIHEVKSSQIDMLTIWHTSQLLPDDVKKL
jgi:plasmid stabilization system protein ParE